MGQGIGIDLGTTNCCIATVGSDGMPGIIPDLEDETGIAARVIPSQVAILPSGETYVGAPARRDSLKNPEMVIQGAKRLMGRGFDSTEVRAVADNAPFEIVPGPARQAWFRVGDIRKSPEDIAAALLSYLKERASDFLGMPVTDAVITVPAHFNDRQRVATREAGEKAGLNVLQLINEPTAAAIAFGWATNANTRVAIYDLGGGTFDISILNIGGGEYEVLSTAGDTFLGGRDFDTRLAGSIVRNHIIGVTHEKLDPIAVLRLRAACEQAKIELSTAQTTEIVLRQFLDFDELRATVTRPDFEKMTRDLVTATTTVCGRALDDAGLKPYDVGSILMVGGQTRMPFIFETVKGYFARVPSTSINPDEAVAVGAAIQAHSLRAPEPLAKLFDVTPLSLGIAGAHNSFASVITRNTKVPCAVTRTFTTVRDNQESVKIVVLQGEHKKASENVLLGQFVLEGIEPAPRLTPHIDVTFALDPSGILNVSALDLKTGAKRNIVIENLTGDPAALAGDVAMTDVAMK